jgi:hypothetical protein
MKRAVVVSDGRLQVETVQGALAASGFEAVVVASVAEAGPLVEQGAVAVVMGLTAEGLEAGQAAALVSMPSGVRRSCIVALVGPGVSTWDGARAFLLGVDLVVAVADAARLGELVSAAVAAKRALVAPLDPNAAGKLGG